jgi:hypothetical protein
VRSSPRRGETLARPRAIRRTDCPTNFPRRSFSK